MQYSVSFQKQNRKCFRSLQSLTYVEQALTINMCQPPQEQIKKQLPKVESFENSYNNIKTHDLGANL